MVKDSYNHQSPAGRLSSKAAKLQTQELSLPFSVVHELQTTGHAPRQEGASRRTSSAFKQIVLTHPERYLRPLQPIGDEANLAAHFVYCTACGSYAEKAVIWLRYPCP
eukprot:5798919-Amphidinium_carterae.1